MTTKGTATTKGTVTTEGDGGHSEASGKDVCIEERGTSYISKPPNGIT